mmetsp:Transcript_30579/g.72131  ORF Transcript_30579/g.72131 Transcript_30579/m.72131 type:complete len:853 (+) Transcript_30579:97-2655(+)
MVSYIDIMAKDAKLVKKITPKIDVKESEFESTYAVTLQNAMSTLEINKALVQGIDVVRLTSRAKWKSRVITISSDKQAFFITHSVIPDEISSELASTLKKPLYAPSKNKKKRFHIKNVERYIRYIDVADIDGWLVGAIGVQKLELGQTRLSKPLSSEKVEQLVTIFHHGNASMVLLIRSKEYREGLVDALKQMKARYNLMSPWINNDQLLMRYIYYDIDQDRSGSIDRKEFRGICKRVNLTVPSDVNRIFNNFAEGKKGISIQKTRKLLLSVATEGKILPVEKLWNGTFGTEVTEVGPKTFLKKFLHKRQGESTATEEDAVLFIKSMKSHGKSISSKKISKTAFMHFLHSKYNDAYDPAAIAPLPSTTKLDMPLSRYWINTSHNTYLLGDQLKSKSSVEAYENALRRGCKCLEFDCWDGEFKKKTNEYVPVIYHGHTLTPSMTFRSACLVTNRYLLANPSTYPIILSLENHCSLPYQKVMAKDMKSIFGDKLFIPEKNQFSGMDLPSPEELRGMVVIKGKRPPEPDEADTENIFQISIQSERDYIDPQECELDDSDDVNDYDINASNAKPLKPSSPSADPHKKKIAPLLRHVTLLHGTKFKSFDQSIDQNQTSMHSIGETKITKLVAKEKENAESWREYNQDHMTRTYPAGSRVDSSNYNPILAWAMGCQLVALNFQTTDSNLALNDGRFRQAGNIGYIPKPASLMGGPKPGKKMVKVTVLSARCLPKPYGQKHGELVDPYIQIDLHDVRFGSTGTEEHVRDSFKTSTVDNNGFCPKWSSNNFAEFEVHNPDVAIIHFRVIDEDLGSDDKIASSAIPFRYLRKGFRCIQLYDDNNTRTGAFESSTLFVNIDH